MGVMCRSFGKELESQVNGEWKERESFTVILALHFCFVHIADPTVA